MTPKKSAQKAETSVAAPAIYVQCFSSPSMRLWCCRRGELIRTGVKVAIVGRPNAGKSSLLNALAARDAAIVSSTPGTTRDTVEISVDLNGHKVQRSFFYLLSYSLAFLIQPLSRCGAMC